MHNIRTNFCKIIEVIKEIIGEETDAKGNYLRRGTKPRFTDIEVIALSLTAECLSIDSENLLFSKLDTEYRGEFSNLISRRQYNDRRKLLFGKIERVRKLMTARLNRQADVFAIDSMPLEICKIARENEIRWAKNLCIIHRTKVIVHLRKNISTAISCIVLVHPLEWSNL